MIVLGMVFWIILQKIQVDDNTVTPGDNIGAKVVPKVGLEPTQCYPPRDFESRASTSFATSACQRTIPQN